MTGFLFALGGWYLSAAASDSPRVITMVIAHKPYSVFERSNEIFAQELHRLSSGSLELRVISPIELGRETDADIPKDEILELMRRGDVQVSTAVVSAFEGTVPEASALDRSFAFDNYSDVAGFLDGEEGESLLSRVSASSPVEALAFTFSGGFRSVALRDPSAASLADIAHQRISHSGGAATNKTLALLGASPADGASDGVEFTYTRVSEMAEPFTYPTIIETRHGVLATMILVDDVFMASLSEKERMALRQAAQAAAIAERDDSIALAAKVKEQLRESGVRIIEVADETRARLRQ
jgi:TRAP-type C4-dicarboxylate transport system substrate-binding protein